MRERMNMKSKMLGALALLTLVGTLFVMQSAQQHAPTADAAVGSIAALNVGTCLTTDATVFKGDCEGLSGGTGSGSWEIRDKKTEVSTLYATYAHDPKTSSDAPRAILMNSDLLQISISDPGRDKRTGVLIGNDAGTNVLFDTNTPPEITTLGSTIDGDLDKLNHPVDSDGIEYTHLEFNFTVAKPSPDNVINSSGNHTLNFGYISGASENPEFLPGDFNVQEGAEVRFYGCVSADATTCANDADGEDVIEKLTVLEVDEDASNGEASGAVAPWLGVNASVPADHNVIILAIYYQTSDKESLIGDQAYYYCMDGTAPSKERDATSGNDVWMCGGTSNALERNETENDATASPPKVANVDYTTDEIADNDALMVQARSDGNLVDRSVSLYLTETERFNGVYQGYLRLTDANGDGRDGGTDPMDWGREVIGGNSDTREDAAVLAVGGPVTIEYRDSDGNKRTLDIEIDTVAPRINVASPAHKSSSGDQSPDFAGTLEDSDSGLADKSFRLVVDNRVDNQGTNADFVLNSLGINAPDADYVMGPAGRALTRIEDYEGYVSDPLFGIVGSASDLYDLGDDSCDNQDQCHILADRYDDGDTNGTFDDNLRLDLQDSSGDVDTRDKEFEIDFQAFVMDMAGNIGFSDSDPSNPRYINDLGEADENKREAGNVLGYYSAHIVTLDEKDPVIIAGQTATGYYGLNSSGKPSADRAGVMVVFDGPIAPATVSTKTFTVELDDGTAASIIDAEVEKNYAFLKLSADLASDATPQIDITNGEKVEDMAGNETFGREVKAFDVNDGISPKLTVTLSGGSGSGSGNEGPDKLTNDQITVNVSSDESLQGAPKIEVVCSSLRWNEGADADVKKDIDDYVANRMRASVGEPGDENLERTPAVANKNVEYDYTCGYKDANGVIQDFGIGSPASGLSRPGDNWDYTWKKSSRFNDGSLTVVVSASDRSRYEFGGQTNVKNYGSASAEFTLDTVLESPTDPGGGELQPDDGGTSKEARPFVMIKFNENSSVTLDSVELDEVEIASEFTQPEMNQFVYWPLTLLRGDHEVAVEATDAAGNEATFEYSFTVEERGDFLLNLLAGWNAISVPADPVDTSIGAVFTNPAIDTVIGWDTDGWRISVRRDGVWESNHQYGTLNEIRAKYGYWVKSNNFVRQPIALTANDRGVGGPRTPVAIDTKDGWNFVGVIDQDGDQTEGDSGNSLKAGTRPITASEYLGASYVRAYTWDATFNRFEELRSNVDMTIGDGVWVYYQGGIAP